MTGGRCGGCGERRELPNVNATNAIDPCPRCGAQSIVFGSLSQATVTSTPIGGRPVRDLRTSLLDSASQSD